MTSTFDAEFKEKILFVELHLNLLEIQVYWLLLLRIQQKRKGKTGLPRRWSALECIVERPVHGHCHQLLGKLTVSDTETFKYYLRMGEQLFTEILARTEHRIGIENTNWRMPWNPD